LRKFIDKYQTPGVKATLKKWSRIEEIYWQVSNPWR